MMSPDSSKILYTIFKDSKIYSKKVSNGGQILPAINHHQIERKGCNFHTFVYYIDEYMTVYSRYNILLVILYVLFGIFALIRDRHACNIDMIHDNSDVWIFGSIYLVLSILLGSVIELLFAHSPASSSLQMIRILIHAVTSLSFFIYENIVLFRPDAVCTEMQGSCLWYWIYITYYLLLIRVINFFLALCTLAITSMNEEPKSEALLEKERAALLAY